MNGHSQELCPDQPEVFCPKSSVEVIDPRVQTLNPDRVFIQSRLAPYQTATVSYSARRHKNVVVAVRKLDCVGRVCFERQLVGG